MASLRISLWQSGSGFYDTFRRWTTAQWRKRGHEVIPLPRQGDVRALGDLIFSMNFSPELARLARDLRRPYVCWIWDALVNFALLSPEWASEYTIVFSFSRGDMERFRKSGYRNVFYLPASTDAESLQAQAATAGPPRYAVGFIGNCYAESASEFRTYRSQYLANGLPPECGLRALERFIGAAAARPPADLRRAFLEFLGREQPDFFRVAPMPPDAVRSLDAALDYFVNVLLYHEIDIRVRSGIVNALAPVGIDLWGDEEGWRPHRVPGVVHHGLAALETDLGRILAETRVCLNMTRTISDGANMRSFEIPAVGGFQLALRTDEMEALYIKDKEIVLYSTPEEARELAEFHLGHDEERRRIAAAGCRRFLAEHTMDHRFAYIEAALKSLGIGRSG